MSEMKDPKTVLKKYSKLLSRYPNVLFTRHNLTKITDNIDTGIRCITIVVSKKFLISELKKTHKLPSQIETIPTDVIEFDSEQWKVKHISVINSIKQKYIKHLCQLGVGAGLALIIEHYITTGGFDLLEFGHEWIGLLILILSMIGIAYSSD
jgi:hypothetical protein